MSQQEVTFNAPTALEPKKKRESRNLRNFFGLNTIEKFFLFLSKSDIHVLRFCTGHTRSIQISIGILVFITGIMAAISSYFAIHSVFFGGARLDISSTIIVGSICFFYAWAIMFFDREIVSATVKTWYMFVGRLFFAIFIGVIISFPVELKIQQDEINQQIKKIAQEKYKDQKAINEEALNEYKKALTEANSNVEKDSVLTSLGKDLLSIDGIIAIKQKDYDDECKRGGCETKAKGKEDVLNQAKNDKIKIQQEIDRYKATLQTQAINIKAELDKKYSYNIQKQKDLDKEIARAEEAHDLLTQFIALKKVHEEKPETQFLSWTIMLFFIMFELFPTIIKLVLSETEYNAYIEARRMLNINKIYGITNYANKALLEELNKPAISIEDYKAKVDRIKKLLTSTTEITDLIEEVLEDSHHKILKIARSDDPATENKENANGNG